MKKLIIPALLAASCHVQAAVLYQENFPSTGTVAPSTISWSHLAGSTATNNSGSWSLTGNQGPDSTAGYLYTTSGYNTVGVAYENTAFSIVPTDITTFTFLGGNVSSTATASFIIQQSGNWFISTTSFTTPATADAATFKSSGVLRSLTFDTLSTSWKALTIDPGTGFTIGAATALSDSAPITRIGVYADGTSGSGTMRFDDLTINGVPEPTTTLLSALAALTLLRRKRA